MLVDVGELPDHQMEPLGLVELGNFLLDSKYSKIWRALDEKLIIKTRSPRSRHGSNGRKWAPITRCEVSGLIVFFLILFKLNEIKNIFCKNQLRRGDSPPQENVKKVENVAHIAFWTQKKTAQQR